MELKKLLVDEKIIGSYIKQMSPEKTLYQTLQAKAMNFEQPLG